MLDADIKKLVSEPPDHPLQRLEADIWVAVAARQQANRALRIIVAGQVTILVLAMAGSALTGHLWAMQSNDSDLDIFSPYTALAASTLLGGKP